MHSIMQALEDIDINSLTLSGKIQIENLCLIIKFDIVHNTEHQILWDGWKSNRFTVDNSNDNLLYIKKSELKKIIKKKCIAYETSLEKTRVLQFHFRRNDFVRLVNCASSERANRIQQTLTVIENIYEKYREYELLYIVQTVSHMDLKIRSLFSEVRMEIDKAEYHRRKLEQFMTHHMYVGHSGGNLTLSARQQKKYNLEESGYKYMRPISTSASQSHALSHSHSLSHPHHGYVNV